MSLVWFNNLIKILRGVFSHILFKQKSITQTTKFVAQVFNVIYEYLGKPKIKVKYFSRYISILI